MRVFVAGGSGLLGVRLVPRLVADGHEVAATTRTPAKASMLAELGATPVVFDAFEADELADAVMDFAPTAVIHSLTHLPDDRAQMAEFGPQHQRTLREGTTNLVAAAQSARTCRR